MKQLILPVRTMYRHSGLLHGFVIRDIKGRFAGSFGGLIWTVITPLATIVTYFFVFSLVMRISVNVQETGTDKFGIFFLCGFFPWTMLAESLSKSVGILVNEANIITKVVFPVELLPISAVSATFLINSVGFMLFLVYLAFTGYASPAWLLVPVAVFIEMVFVLGLALFLSALCVFIRDIGELLNVVIMVWFFGTPVIYPLSLVPERFAFLYSLNPMVEFVDFYRNLVLMNMVDMRSLVYLCAYAVMSYGIGTWFFLRSKNAFGDVL